jgi:hypothetical protein
MHKNCVSLHVQEAQGVSLDPNVVISVLRQANLRSRIRKTADPPPKMHSFVGEGKRAGRTSTTISARLKERFGPSMGGMEWPWNEVDGNIIWTESPRPMPAVRRIQNWGAPSPEPSQGQASPKVQASGLQGLAALLSFLVKPSLCLLQMFVAKVPVHLLDHGDASPGHPSDRGDVIASH